VLQPTNSKAYSVILSVTAKFYVTDIFYLKARRIKACNAVTHKTPLNRQYFKNQQKSQAATYQFDGNRWAILFFGDSLFYSK
jgi:hypothetical protein